MIPSISLRDLTRGEKAFKDFDMVRIEDKKTKKNKGLIVSSTYAKQVEKILAEIIAKQKQQEFNSLYSIISELEIKEEFQNMNSQQIKASKRKRYE